MEVVRLSSIIRRATKSSAPRRKVSFNKIEPVSYHYFQQGVVPAPLNRRSFGIPVSLQSVAVGALFSVSSFVVLYVLLQSATAQETAVGFLRGGHKIAAIDATGELKSTKPGLMGRESRSRALPHTSLHRKRVGSEAATAGAILGKEAEGEEEADDLDLDLGLEDMAEEDSSASGDARPKGRRAVVPRTGKRLRNAAIRGHEDGHERRDEAVFGHNEDPALLPVMLEAFDEIQEIAQEIERDAEMMKQSFQTLLRGTARNKMAKQTSEHDRSGEAEPFVTSPIAVGGLRKHLRRDTEHNGAAPPKAARSEVAPSAQVVIEALMRNGEVETSESGDAVIREDEPNVLESLREIRNVVVSSVVDGIPAGSALRGKSRGAMREVESHEELETSDDAFLHVTLKTEAENTGVVDAVFDVIEELRKQDDGDVTAAVMANVSDVVASSATKLRGTPVVAGTNEAAIMNEVVEIINEEMDEVVKREARGSFVRNNRSDAVVDTERGTFSPGTRLSNKIRRAIAQVEQ